MDNKERERQMVCNLLFFLSHYLMFPQGEFQRAERGHNKVAMRRVDIRKKVVCISVFFSCPFLHIYSLESQRSDQSQ